MIHITKGLDIPIAGAPAKLLEPGPSPSTVALLGPDTLGLKPTILVNEGDRVALGQPLFADRKNPGVMFTSPGAGTIKAINRGPKRVFQSIVLALEGEEQVSFAAFAGTPLQQTSAEQVRSLLLESGLWTAFRTRPYSRIPASSAPATAIFITAMDTNPLAPCVPTILQGYGQEFTAGLEILQKLCPRIFLCKAPATAIPGEHLAGLTVEEFSGPHPAGLPGTHIHFLDPVGAHKSVWHIGYQDVTAIGHLFLTGQLLVDRIVSLAGPRVVKPRLLKTRLGASLADLVRGQLQEGENRVISGSILAGRTATGPLNFLGRYHCQISVILEERTPEFLSWLAPGAAKFSIKPLFLANFLGRQSFAFTSARHGAKRAIVPIGSFERVMPLDIEPTYLLRALTVQDTEQAQALGCLELDEEDLALLTFVDPSKNDFGPMLRQSLALIEKEG